MAAITDLAWSDPSSTSSSNLPPIRFHEVHGEKVRLFRDNCLAKVICSDKVLTNRPVGVNEKICIRVLECYGYYLRFGLTTNDPVNRDMDQDCSTKQGNWVKELNDRFARVDLVLCFYVNEEGEVYYTVNGDRRGILFDGVDTSPPLWAFFTFRGKIELIDPHRHR